MNEHLLSKGCSEWISNLQLQIRSGNDITGDEKQKNSSDEYPGGITSKQSLQQRGYFASCQLCLQFKKILKN